MSKLSAWIVEHAAASRLTMRVSHLKGHTVGAVPSTPQVAAEESACILRLLFPLEDALASSLQRSQQVVEIQPASRRESLQRAGAAARPP